MLRSVLLLTACLSMTINGLSASLDIDLRLKSKAAILIDADTGAILYEKDAYTLYYPASITKVATALYAIEQYDLDLDALVTAEQDSLGWVSVEKKQKSKYTLPPYWLEPGASHIGIQVGEQVPMRDLLYGMMLASGDDCSNLIAKHLAGDINKFMDGLNHYLAHDVGCQQTRFSNPHGLFFPDHQTSAYDMARLTQRALKLPLFRSIVAAKEYQRRETNKSKSVPVRQGNRLIRPGKHYYDKAIGVKTGYIEKAQNTFVGAAVDNGRTLIAVLLYCDERDDMFADAKKLLEAGFSEQQVSKVYIPKGKQNFTYRLKAGGGLVHTYTDKDVAIRYFPSHEPAVRCHLHWDEVSAPVVQDQRVGTLQVTGTDGSVIDTVALYAQNAVDESWTTSVLSRLLHPTRSMLLKELGAAACAALLLGGFAWELRRERRK